MRLLGLLLLSFVSCAWAAPLTVPSGNFAVKDLAEFNTLYPNPKITPQLCSYKSLGRANVIAVHSIAVPTQNRNVFIELASGANPLLKDGSTGIIVDVNNPANWKVMKTTESVFCGATTHTSDGRICQVGGHVARQIKGPGGQLLNFTMGLSGIRLLAPLTTDTTLKRVNTLKYQRWYPSIHLLSDGNILINGGTSGASNGALGVTSAEIFNPAKPTAPTTSIPMPGPWLKSFEDKPFYPIMWQLPTGHVFLFADSNSCILNHRTGKCITVNGKLVGPPARPNGIASTYPFTASAVTGTMVPNAKGEVNKVDIIVFGGTKRSDHPNHTSNWGAGGYNPTARASRYSHRLTISWSRTSATSPWQFKFGNWVQEDMGYPRVMPDATLLPNGDVVILNGCQAGVAGYPNGNISISQYPAFWSSLYQPDRPVNARYTLMCGTQQPRGYHGTATLTQEGKILVAGHDRPRWYYGMPKVPWFKDGTGGTYSGGYNVEMFSPPYVFDTANKPQINSINGGTGTATLGYNAKFTLQYGPAKGAGPVAVSSVVLVAPSSTTHSCNMNQKVIQLNFKKLADGTLEVTTPLHPFIAAPQYYMIFINNVKTYSAAKWIKLVDAQGLGKQTYLP